MGEYYASPWEEHKSHVCVTVLCTDGTPGIPNIIGTAEPVSFNSYLLANSTLVPRDYLLGNTKVDTHMLRSVSSGGALVNPTNCIQSPTCD